MERPRHGADSLSKEAFTANGKNSEKQNIPIGARGFLRRSRQARQARYAGSYGIGFRSPRIFRRFVGLYAYGYYLVVYAYGYVPGFYAHGYYVPGSYVYGYVVGSYAHGYFVIRYALRRPTRKTARKMRSHGLPLRARTG